MRDSSTDNMVTYRRPAPNGKVRAFLDKIATKESEPGLSRSQLMLTNLDLKPGMLSSTSPTSSFTSLK